MAILYYGADSTGTGVRIGIVDGTDSIIGNGVTIGSTDSSAMYLNTSALVTTSITVLGTVFGLNNAIYINSSDTVSVDLDIGSDGSVFSLDGDAIVVVGNSTNYQGRLILRNDGLIRGSDEGITAYYLDLIDIVNSGEISSSGIFPGNAALSLIADVCQITNTGVISSANDEAIELRTSFGIEGGEFELTNSGIIRGPSRAIYSDRRVDFISNSGEIYGNLRLDISESATLDYADTVINTGLIVGDVELGFGDDLFDGANGSIFGTIDAGAGNDVIKSGIEDDLIIGGSGADEMWGGAGIDTASYEGSADGVRVSLNAGRGWFGDAQGDVLREIENLIGSDRRDTLIGNSAANLIEGGNADDVLNGLAGDDTLLGGNGADNILGGTGNDYISGDRHQDKLTGGSGEDIFAYLNILDSGPAQSERDNITDFTQGQDLIDLTALGDLNFGGSSFSGVAGEIIHYHVAGGTRTVVEIDTDGDSNADFGILLSNAALTMTAADFLFV
ncbi:MAG: hypothetical protein CMK07_02435 [Ponticaulis sp.]|nr:hypothetical protein [Ponticaulis sp.]